MPDGERQGGHTGSTPEKQSKPKEDNSKVDSSMGSGDGVLVAASTVVPGLRPASFQLDPGHHERRERVQPNCERGQGGGGRNNEDGEGSRGTYG